MYMLNNYHLTAFKKGFDKFGPKKNDTTTLSLFYYYYYYYKYFFFCMHLQDMQNFTQPFHKERIRNTLSSFIFLNIEQKIIFFIVTF